MYYSTERAAHINHYQEHTLIPTYSGRGRPSNAVREARMAFAQAPLPTRTDDEILTDLTQRFQVLAALTTGAVDGTIRSSIVTGGPGTGKTYNVEQILRQGWNPVYDIVSGAITPINLYKAAYRLRTRGSVLVIDDADKLLYDEEGLNLMKKLADTSDIRTISYMKESPSLKEEQIPNRFDFNGSVMIISNVDFEKIALDAKSKIAPHIEAMLSRSMCLNLRLHTREEISIWVKHVMSSDKFFDKEGLTSEQGRDIITYIEAHKDRLKELSLRTPRKLAQLMRTTPKWQEFADVLFIKN